MRKYLIIILMMGYGLSALAQQYTRQEKIEKLMAMKVAFISNKINLTTEEAQQFWPVYNEFFRLKNKLTREKKAINMKLQGDWNSFTEDKKIELTDKLVALKLKEARLEQVYHEKFKSVLSIDKVIRLYSAENQYKNYLLRQIKGQNNLTPSQRERDFKRK